MYVNVCEIGKYEICSLVKLTIFKNIGWGEELIVIFIVDVRRVVIIFIVFVRRII